MAEVFDSIDHDRPTCFLAYTVKGWGTPIAGHKDNHGGLMTKAQMADWQAHMGVPEGEEWEPLATVEDKDALKAFLGQVPFFSAGRRRYTMRLARARHRRFPMTARSPPRRLRQDPRHLAKGDSELADRI
jgi:pyruvate dehydrogenase E1 component